MGRDGRQDRRWPTAAVTRGPRDSLRTEADAAVLHGQLADAASRGSLAEVRAALVALDQKGEAGLWRHWLPDVLDFSGEHDRAVALFQELLAENPEDEVTLFNYSASLYRAGHIEAALGAAQAALDLRTGDPLDQVFVGEITATLTGDLEPHENALRGIEAKYASRSPDTVDDWQEAVAVASALANGAGEVGAARAYLERSYTLGADAGPWSASLAPPLWAYTEGEVALAESNYQAAITSFERALTSEFKGYLDIPDLYWGLGRAYAGLGDRARMRDAYRSALEAAPVSLHSREMLAALGGR